jgi:hypothetical protein
MENIKNNKTGLKKSYGRNWLIALFVALTALDLLIVIDLIRRLIETNDPLVWAISFFLIFIIDILPIFVLAPLVNKLATGIIKKEDSTYILQIITVIGIVVLFVLAVAFYATASITEADRFLVTDESRSSGSALGFAGFVAERDALAAVVNDNYMVAAILVGVLPVISTLVSFMLNFISIGKKYLRDQLAELEERKRTINESISKAEQNNMCLAEFKRIMQIISGLITDFAGKSTPTLELNKENEALALSFANSEIKQNVYVKLDSLESSVRSELERFDPTKINDWTLACEEIRENVDAEIQKIETQYLK